MKNIFDKVSVIVPFYNAEKFLDRCIKSILNQTYTNIELILINNKSDDKSRNIAKKYCSDRRVNLLDCENKGVSYSRNMGIKCVTGEWILFVDADDYIEEYTLEELIRVGGIEDNIVCVESGYVDEKINSEIIMKNNNNEKSVMFSKNDIIGELFGSTVGHYQGYLWNKLLKSEVIKNNNIWFDTEIVYNEDRLFLLKYFMSIKQKDKIYYISKICYHYIHHCKSAMGRIKNQPRDKIVTEIKAFEKMYIILEKYENKQIMEKFYAESINACFLLLTKISFTDAQAEKKYIKAYVKRCKAYNLKTFLKKMICRNDIMLHIYERIS